MLRLLRFPQPTIVQVTSEEEFDKMVAETDPAKILVIDCSTTWCGPCKVFRPTFEQFAEVRLIAASFA